MARRILYQNHKSRQETKISVINVIKVTFFFKKVILNSLQKKIMIFFRANGSSTHLMEPLQAFAVSRNLSLQCFGKPAEVRSEAVSCLGESRATLGRTPLSDTAEIIGEGTEKS